MIVVERPSAAGKTTWITDHCDPASVVPEATIAQAAPAPDPFEQAEAAAEFWTVLNSARWEHAQRIERQHGMAVCDSDPFKLHYIWTLWRTGHASGDQWRAALEANRQAFGAGRRGLADLIFVTIPDAHTLTRRRRNDHSRRRRHFDLHIQLAGPLAEWYHAVERLDPTRHLETPPRRSATPRPASPAPQRNRTP